MVDGAQADRFGVTVGGLSAAAASAGSITAFVLRERIRHGSRRQPHASGRR